jgi:hypothetical protein
MIDFEQLIRTTFRTRKDRTTRLDEMSKEKDVELSPLEGW